MAAHSSVNLGSRRINIYRFTGEVVDSQRSSETHVSSGNNGIVSSSTTHYNEIFLRAPNGDERSVEVAASGVSVRTGNTVTVTWGIVEGKDKGSYTTVYNHNTKATGHIARAVNEVAGPPFVNLAIVVLVFVGVFGVFSGSLTGFALAAGVVYFFYWLIQRRKKLKAAMEAALSDLK